MTKLTGAFAMGKSFNYHWPIINISTQLNTIRLGQTVWPVFITHTPFRSSMSRCLVTQLHHVRTFYDSWMEINLLFVWRDTRNCSFNPKKHLKLKWAKIYIHTSRARSSMAINCIGVRWLLLPLLPFAIAPLWSSSQSDSTIRVCRQRCAPLLLLLLLVLLLWLLLDCCACGLLLTASIAIAYSRIVFDSQSTQNVPKMEAIVAQQAIHSLKFHRNPEKF